MPASCIRRVTTLPVVSKVATTEEEAGKDAAELWETEVPEEVDAAAAAAAAAATPTEAPPEAPPSWIDVSWPGEGSRRRRPRAKAGMVTASSRRVAASTSRFPSSQSDKEEGESPTASS
jgi:hypothetical protein